MLSNFYIISFILVVLVLVLNTKDGFIVGGVDQTPIKFHVTKLVTAKDKTRERLKKIPKKKLEPQILNRRDLYVNLCPSVYNKKQLKLLNASKQVNQLPGYSSNGIVNITRKIPYPEDPIPYNFEFKI